MRRLRSRRGIELLELLFISNDDDDNDDDNDDDFHRGLFPFCRPVHFK